MMSLISLPKAQKMLAENMRIQRLSQELTQEGLAVRAGVSVRTLRKFEQEGVISIESFLKLCMALGSLEELLQATAPKQAVFTSIDEVLESKPVYIRKRGSRK